MFYPHYNFTMGICDAQLMLDGMKLIVEKYSNVPEKKKMVSDALCEINYIKSLCYFADDGETILEFKEDND